MSGDSISSKDWETILENIENLSKTPSPPLRPIFPKTVLISVMLHGEIFVKPKTDFTETKIFQETVPKSKIVIITASSLGNVNIKASYKVPFVNNAIHFQFQKNKTNKKTKLKNIISIAKLLQTNEEQFIAEFQEYFMQNSEKWSPHGKFQRQRYIDDFHKSYNMHIIRNGKEILDKGYSITLFEKKTTNYGITVLNPLEGQSNDLLEIMGKMSQHQSIHTMDEADMKKTKIQVSLEEIITFLNSHGAKNIILFDFSCNSFSCRGLGNFNRIAKGKYREMIIGTTEKKLRVMYKPDLDQLEQERSPDSFHLSSSASSSTTKRMNRKRKRIPSIRKTSRVVKRRRISGRS